jgi:hypothetical protein
MYDTLPPSHYDQSNDQGRGCCNYRKVLLLIAENMTLCKLLNFYPGVRILRSESSRLLVTEVLSTYLASFILLRLTPKDGHKVTQ